MTSSNDYSSAYIGIRADERGKFTNFVRRPDASHMQNGFWTFLQNEDERKAYAVGMHTPEDILISADSADQFFDTIKLRWVPGHPDSANMGLGGMTGNAREHLTELYCVRKFLGKGLSFRGRVPLYPADARLKPYWERKRAMIQKFMEGRLAHPAASDQSSSRNNALASPASRTQKELLLVHAHSPLRQQSKTSGHARHASNTKANPIAQIKSPRMLNGKTHPSHAYSGEIASPQAARVPLQAQNLSQPEGIKQRNPTAHESQMPKPYGCSQGQPYGAAPSILQTQRRNYPRPSAAASPLIQRSQPVRHEDSTAASAQPERSIHKLRHGFSSSFESLTGNAPNHPPLASPLNFTLPGDRAHQLAKQYSEQGQQHTSQHREPARTQPFQQFRNPLPQQLPRPPPQDSTNRSPEQWRQSSGVYPLQIIDQHTQHPTCQGIQQPTSQFGQRSQIPPSRMSSRSRAPQPFQDQVSSCSATPAEVPQPLSKLQHVYGSPQSRSLSRSNSQLTLSCLPSPPTSSNLGRPQSTILTRSRSSSDDLDLTIRSSFDESPTVEPDLSDDIQNLSTIGGSSATTAPSSLTIAVSPATIATTSVRAVPDPNVNQPPTASAAGPATQLHQPTPLTSDQVAEKPAISRKRSFIPSPDAPTQQHKQLKVHEQRGAKIMVPEPMPSSPVPTPHHTNDRPANLPKRSLASPENASAQEPKLNFNEQQGTEDKLSAQVSSPPALDMYPGLPCMGCGEGEGHKADCHIGNLNARSKLTALDYDNLAKAVHHFDPGPWIMHEAQSPASEPEAPEDEIKGIAGIIKEQETYKGDEALNALPDDLMILQWAFKTSSEVEIIDSAYNSGIGESGGE